MPNFQYTAQDQTGATQQGVVEANDQNDAYAKVTASGLTPTAIAEAQQTAPEAASGKAKKGGLLQIEIGGGATKEDLCVFTRQMATLVQAGLPLLRSLEVMIKQQEKKPKFRRVLEAVAEKVRSGGNLSEGLSEHPKVFDKLYCNMVKAGEAGGVLDVVLDRVAMFMEKSIRTAKKVKSAMIYPSVVMVVAVGIVALLMVVVVPKFQGIFQQMLKGAPMPTPTQIVIGISDFFVQQKWLALGCIIVSVFAFMGLKRSKKGSRGLDWLGIKLPKFGDVIVKSNVARITRTFGTLLESGVPILQALLITRETISNSFFADAMTKMHDAVRDGEPLANPMGQQAVFPTMVTSMVEIGEETGELPAMLNRIADNYDEDIDNAVAALVSIIEPIMIVFLAVVVGFIVIALFLPIVSIIETLGK